jgi:hypothetical protein
MDYYGLSCSFKDYKDGRKRSGFAFDKLKELIYYPSADYFAMVHTFQETMPKEIYYNWCHILAKILNGEWRYSSDNGIIGTKHFNELM